MYSLFQHYETAFSPIENIPMLLMILRMLRRLFPHNSINWLVSYHADAAGFL
jgi:hypothetical protein